jgi:hypothetical protein
MDGAREAGDSRISWTNVVEAFTHFGVRRKNRVAETFIEKADPMRLSSSFRSATNRLSSINGLPEIMGLELL